MLKKSVKKSLEPSQPSRSHSITDIFSSPKKRIIDELLDDRKTLTDDETWTALNSILLARESTQKMLEKLNSKKLLEMLAQANAFMKSLTEIKNGIENVFREAFKYGDSVCVLELANQPYETLGKKVQSEFTDKSSHTKLKECFVSVEADRIVLIEGISKIKLAIAARKSKHRKKDQIVAKVNAKPSVPTPPISRDSDEKRSDRSGSSQESPKRTPSPDDRAWLTNQLIKFIVGYYQADIAYTPHWSSSASKRLLRDLEKDPRGGLSKQTQMIPEFIEAKKTGRLVDILVTFRTISREVDNDLWLTPANVKEILKHYKNERGCCFFGRSSETSKYLRLFLEGKANIEDKQLAIEFFLRKKATTSEKKGGRMYEILKRTKEFALANADAYVDRRRSIF